MNKYHYEEKNDPIFDIFFVNQIHICVCLLIMITYDGVIFTQMSLSNKIDIGIHFADLLQPMVVTCLSAINIHLLPLALPGFDVITPVGFSRLSLVYIPW